MRSSAVVAFFFSAYALVGLFRHWRFQTSAYDLGIYDQFLWHLSRFEWPSSSVRGLSNMFGDHFDPIVLVLVPAYWVAAAPETLLVIQCALLAASIVPVWLFARDRLPGGAAMALTIAYGFFWGLQRTAEFDFHDYAFAPLLIALSILAIDRQWWRLMWASALALVFVKEDLIPLLVFEALYLAILGERKRARLLASMGGLAFVLVVGFVIPQLSDSGTFGYTNSYREIIEKPGLFAAKLVYPPQKLVTAFLWVAPFAMLPLCSPLIVLLIPFALSRFLSDTPNHWAAAYHYSAPIAPIVAMSAADGLARVARRFSPARRSAIVTGLAGASVLLSAILPGQQPMWDLFKRKHYVQDARERTGRDVMDRLPVDASIVAQSAIVPHLTHRDRIYVLRAEAPDADFVIAAEHLSAWPLRSFAEIQSLLDDRQRGGYHIAFQKDGWTVLSR